MAKFSAGRCFSVPPGYHYHLAGYSQCNLASDPDDKRQKTLPKRGESGEQIVGCVEEVFREHGETFCRIGGCIRIDTAALSPTRSISS